jgi:3-oxoacyl-[acyl-carrier protein] reductase
VTPKGRFQGRIALVTGGGRGLGRAVVLKLASEGATVAVNDIQAEWANSVAQEVLATGASAFPVPTDVRSEEQVASMVKGIIKLHGTIDILVNNAGILGIPTLIEQITMEDWNQVLATNIGGIFNCTKAVWPSMKAQRSGKIVNVSSSAGRSTSTFGAAHYTASKAAVLGFTRHAAREGAPWGINVNATAPGSMDTQMVRERATAAYLDEERQRIPAGRLGTPDDQANLVSFLCSDESSYINGATIDINGASLLL